MTPVHTAVEQRFLDSVLADYKEQQRAIRIRFHQSCIAAVELKFDKFSAFDPPYSNSSEWYSQREQAQHEQALREAEQTRDSDNHRSDELLLLAFSLVPGSSIPCTADTLDFFSRQNARETAQASTETQNLRNEGKE